MIKGPVKRRTYDNSGRAAQARATRRKILAAASDALVDNGYAATTMSVIAERAGVSVETVYKQFGTKRALTREVLDIAIAGDDEPVAMVNRSEAQAIASAPNAKEMVRLYARYVRGIHERTGPLRSIVMHGARAGEDDLQAFAAEADSQRLTGSAIFARRLLSTGEARPDLEPNQARDIIWTLNAPDIYRMLTVDRGWSAEDYEQVLGRALAGALLATPGD